MQTDSRMIVIGASAGGHDAIKSVITEIPANINAAFAVVLHTAVFARALNRVADLNVKEAEHGSEITEGSVFIVKPNHHLYMYSGKIFLSKGPRENRFRPSIDVLFRSTAVAYQNRTVGVLMTGRLNDGTVGLEAIKKCETYKNKRKFCTLNA